MFKTENTQGFSEVTPEELKDYVGKVRLIDVRRPEEFTGELGHIETAELVTLGPDLQNFLDNGNKDETIVFVCRSGARSGQATLYSQHIGYKSVHNMKGGMLRWNDLKFPIEK
jgi:hydroxyacylglutathione hydrolase